MNIKKPPALVAAIFFCLVAARADAAALQISSPAFSSGHAIPQQYTCSGVDISPELAWKNVPQGTKSLALTVRDPDAPAGIWTHWVMYNIPASLQGLPAHVPPRARLANGGEQGLNSFGKMGYGGPCPPYGNAPHRYYFRLYALDTHLQPMPDATVTEIETAMKGHILSSAVLMGRYGRGKTRTK